MTPDIKEFLIKFIPLFFIFPLFAYIICFAFYRARYCPKCKIELSKYYYLFGSNNLKEDIGHMDLKTISKKGLSWKQYDRDRRSFATCVFVCQRCQQQYKYFKAQFSKDFNKENKTN